MNRVRMYVQKDEHGREYVELLETWDEGNQILSAAKAEPAPARPGTEEVVAELAAVFLRHAVFAPKLQAAILEAQRRAYAWEKAREYLKNPKLPDYGCFQTICEILDGEHGKEAAP